MPAFFLLCTLGACASIPPSVDDWPADAAPVELDDTPFHAQAKYQCGPAALLTVLEDSGADARLDDLVKRVYLPGRQGSLQSELLAATRAHERLPYRIDGRVSALAAELAAGRPVLVLQNLGVSWIPRWHYAVVVGLDGASGDVILRSGTERRRVTGLDTFLRTWRRSGYWGIVALRPGNLPAEPDPVRYFDALAGLEETGHAAAAQAGWQSAVRAWPGLPLARFGLANNELLRGNHAAAAEAYRRLLRDYPGLAAARNNLAIALLRLERPRDARREAVRALADADDDAALSAEIRRTLGEIDAALR